MKKTASGRTFVLAMLMAIFAVSQAEADLIGLLDLSGRDGAGLGDGESSGNFTSPKTFDATSDLSLNDVAWSDGGFSGVVDISLTATATGTLGPGNAYTATPIARGGKGAFGIYTTDDGAVGSLRATISDYDGTMTLSDIQFTYVSGDALSSIASLQFAAVYIGNYQTSNSDAGTINGVAISGGDIAGDTTASGRNDLSTYASSVVIDAISGNGWSINGVDIAVTAIPEPSSIVLLGVAGLSLLALMRRRVMPRRAAVKLKD